MSLTTLPAGRPAVRSVRRALIAAVVVLALVVIPVAGGAGTHHASAQDVAASDWSAGDQMANFALQYVGSPYVWGGGEPGGFDCSGFTEFVAMNVLGEEITHEADTQMGYGTPVSADALEPGDLVFFAGTYEPGISHVGIYVGGGQFVHAENESTGVVVSDLWGSYAGYYAGAMRLVQSNEPPAVG